MTVAELTRRKSVEQTIEASEQEGYRLRRELSALDVMIFGVGVTVGAGVFVMTGAVAASDAGPSVTVSFALAALVCGLAAFCYAEFAAMVPVAGSAYTFAYATFGELVAFVIGWDLMLELGMAAGTIAVGWSGYLNETLDQVFGVTLPTAITAPPKDGGVVNLTGVLLVLALTAVLVRGIKLTSRATGILVAITLGVLALVVIVGATQIDTGNWTPYFPFGLDGTVSGASLVFFAFIGFDIVATTAEETKDPRRDMPRGILGSLGIVTVIYIAVAAVVTGMVAYETLGSPAPVADAFQTLEKPWVAAIIYAGALVALTKTAMILLLGQSRVTFAMARDRLLPDRIARTHPRFGTPHRISLFFGAVVAVIAGVFPFDDLSELVNIGTLFAFVLVAAGVLVLRRTEPDRERPFRTPAVWLVAPLSIAGSVVLIARLEPVTWLRFGAWMALGLVVYFLFARRLSRAAWERRDAAGG